MKASESQLEKMMKDNPDLGIEDGQPKTNGLENSAYDTETTAKIGLVRWHFEDAPPTYNQTLRMFKYAENRYKDKIQQWALRFAIRFRKAYGPSAALMLPMRVEMTRYTPQTLDIDGLYGSLKIPLDALVKADLLPDDDPDCIAEVKADQAHADSLSMKLTLRHVEM